MHASTQGTRTAQHACDKCSCALACVGLSQPKVIETILYCCNICIYRLLMDQSNKDKSTQVHHWNNIHRSHTVQTHLPCFIPKEHPAASMEHAAEDMNSLHYGAYQLSWKLLAWLALLRLLGIQRWIAVSSSVARSDSEPEPQRQPEQESSSEELQNTPYPVPRRRGSRREPPTTAEIPTPKQLPTAPRRPAATPNPAPGVPQRTECPRCGNPMIRRQNRSNRGWFLGCSTFPTCRGTRPLPEKNGTD